MTDGPTHPPEEIKDKIDRAIADPAIPKFYINGFQNFISAADLTTFFERNGRVVAVLDMPYGVAKSYALKLLELVAVIERHTGQEVLTIDQVQELLSKANGPKPQ